MSADDFRCFAAVIITPVLLFGIRVRVRTK